MEKNGKNWNENYHISQAHNGNGKKEKANDDGVDDGRVDNTNRKKVVWDFV